MSEELCVMTLKNDAKFKGKLTCGLKIDMRNLVNFHASRRMSEKLHFDWILLSKSYRNLDRKSTEELCFMTMKSDAKFEEKLTLGSNKDMRNLVNFKVSSGKSERLHFDVLLFSIAYKGSAKNYSRIIFHDTEKRSKHGGKTDFFLNNDLRNSVNFNPRSGKSENFHFDKLPFVESM